MADSTPTRIGQVNGSGAVDALFLKLFAGEILTTFQAKTIMRGRHVERTIKNGKSASFPVTGTAAASYHTPGAEILGQAIKHNEKVITIDGVLIADAAVAEIDELMNHYDVRKPYADELGFALAKKYDIHVMREAILGARAAATITGGNGGTRVSLGVNMMTETLANKAAAVAAGIFSAAQALDEKDVPEEGRFCILKPSTYSALVQNKDAINKDWGGDGMYSEGNIRKLGGVEIVKSNLLPQDDSTSDTYHGLDATRPLDANPGVYGLVMVPNAVGTLKLRDLAFEQGWDMRRQVTLMLAKMAVGHGYLRPECSAELYDPTAV